MSRLRTKAELTGHDVFELAAGELPPHWGADSLYLEDEDMQWLWPCLRAALPAANPYGPNVILPGVWEKLLRAFWQQPEPNPDRVHILEQMDEFVRAAFEKTGAATLYGV